MNTQIYTQDEATDFGHHDTARHHVLSLARLNALMAQVRDRQLRHAQRGEVIESAKSAKFAQRASTLRVAMNQMARVTAAAAVLLTPFETSFDSATRTMVNH